MKYEPPTKLDKTNKTKSKKIDDDVISENYDVIVIFRIFGQFGGSPEAHSGHKSSLFSNSNLFFTKTENRTKKSLTQLSHFCFE